MSAVRPPTVVALVLVTLFVPFATVSRSADGVPAHQAGSQENAQAGASTETSAQPYPAWKAAVERHQPGQMDAAAKSISGWSKAQLEEAGRGVLVPLSQAKPGSEDARKVFGVIDRAVILHTDIALATQGAGAGSSTNLLLAVDGRTEGLGNTLHLEFAAELLGLGSDRREARDKTVGAWYRAVSAFLLHRHRWGEAGILLTRWRQALLREKTPDPRVFPNDEDFMFAYGCLHEGLASPDARVALGDAFQVGGGAGPEGAYAGLERSFSPGAMPWRFQARVADFAVHLEQAFQAYRRVVESNRRAAEARVRLGHVECVRGSCGSGMRNMRAGDELATGDPTVRYYAAMFLGQAEESRGRYEEARKEYERAAALFPLAQSPLLALGALADRTGDRPAAGRHASRLWSLPADGAHRPDPWWDYDGGPRDAEALLRQVFRLMEGGVDDRQ